jgi:hypothetical protein
MSDRPNPEVRPTKDGKGIFLDGVDRYSRESFVRELTGDVPEGFPVMLQQALAATRAMHDACGYSEDDVNGDDNKRMHVRDVLLIAAWALTDSANAGHGQNPLGFVQRAKQVIDWCKPGLVGLTALEALEARGRELARMLAQRVWRTEGFFVVLFDHAAGGHFTWLSSTDRRTMIELLGRAFQALKEDQGARS